MNTKTRLSGSMMLSTIIAGLGLLFSTEAWAHCDTLSGPVVMDAKKAIEANDVAPVLKWIRLQDETEIRSLFDKTLVARQKGKDVQELVDMHFFETLVRVHRAGEGAPYTGLKPADTPIEPGIEAAEKALETESDTSLVEALQAELESRVHERFERTVEAKKRKDDSVADGREYVEAYVDYIHYVERVHSVLSKPVVHGHGHEASTDEHAETAASATVADHH